MNLPCKQQGSVYSPMTVGTRGVVVGLVVNVRPHPKGDRIWLADVDLGQAHPVQIVWGGKPVVRSGSLVPVAPPGARVDGKKMRRRTYRGKVSHGMLCSLAELGWDRQVKDRVALLNPAECPLPGMSLDGYADRWQSLVSNRRMDLGINVLAATMKVFSGGFRIASRGNLQRERTRG